MQQVRDAFVKDFIPNNLGVGHLTRNEWLANYRELTNEIFNAKESQLILVVDGTYCHCQKSSNNYFQRKTFSVQKKTHLVKPFLFSTSNGKIVDVFGLHETTKNDASIMNDVL